VHSASSVVTPRLSVIVPVLDEADEIEDLLQSLPTGDVEVIIVDGGSSDATCEIAARHDVRVVHGARGRAAQMNAGAHAASGDLFLFLHADVRLPRDFRRTIGEFAGSDRAWGRFDVQLSGSHPAFRLIEFMMNHRSRLTGICTGDQAIFVTRHAFEQVGGFPDISLMEDIAISRALKKISRPWRSHGKVRCSSRRWEKHGIARTILLMWRLRLAYFFGATPELLARRYYG
jgi:rSAM/selenodomain-associated transferase 2